jgi:DNA-binding NtrC family response regulator
MPGDPNECREHAKRCWALAAAIALLNSTDRPPISVVFTDIQLGGSVTGWDVAEAFRKAHPEIPVIYTSGLLQSHARQVPEAYSFRSLICLPTLSN